MHFKKVSELFVKVCGVRDEDELEIVEKFADATGVVVECESKRRISLEKAREIVEIAKIPVFAVSTSDEFEVWGEIIERSNTSFIQIHSKTINQKVIERIKGEFGVYIMKTFEIPISSENPEEDADKIIDEMERYEADRFLLDSGKGSGKIHDLRVSRIIARKFDVLLAGGLNQRNVGRIVRYVRPFGVDVSSGVEKNGRKDQNLIRMFVKEVKG